MLWQLFLTFFRIGAFTIGGGYAMLPLIQREVVENRGWLKHEDFLDAVAVAQSAPGVLAVNIALGVGMRLGGLAEALVAALGAALPSFLIILVIATFLPRFKEYRAVENFLRGAQPAVLALLLYAAWTLGRSALRGYREALLAGAGFLALIFLGLHPILAILGAAAVGAVFWRPGDLQEKAGLGKEG